MDITTRRLKLRPVEAIPAEHRGQRMLRLTDPFRLSEAVLFAPMALVPVLQRLDGRHTFEDIKAQCKSRHGMDVTEESYRAMVSRLEEAHFLEGDGFASWSASIKDAYLSAPVRPNFLAGRSYDSDPARLRSHIDGFFKTADGPGMPARNSSSPAVPLRGVVAPHIDFHRGGSTFAWAYKSVAERADADLFVVLGTVHAPTKYIYNLTAKSFETPFGILETSAEFVEELSDRLEVNPFQDEFVHRGEHSIEFQAVFLQYLFADVRPVQFVPILVGSLHRFVAEGRSPRGDAQVETFIAALSETITAYRQNGRMVCLIASVDFAHVGPQFGDEDPVGEVRLKELAQADGKSLEAVCRGEAEAFYWSVAEDGDARNVCGLAPIYTMLRVLNDCEGEVLRYSQWPDPNGTVTFSSVALT
ncbi:MAG: AmmeMemoRadiSam system protein B [Nitrospinae bacterium]|nr:AmmeMemoRadiSam system protein B [Nitrospinota bacterium]